MLPLFGVCKTGHWHNHLISCSDARYYFSLNSMACLALLSSGSVNSEALFCLHSLCAIGIIASLDVCTYIGYSEKHV